MENWKGRLEEWYKEQVEVRHMLHRNPELPYEERETTRFLKQQPRYWGQCYIQWCIAGQIH